MRPIIAPAPKEQVKPAPVPTLSVIIAAYQAAESVGDAVRSALEQTAPPHEVVVCDDGSTDPIEDALEPYRDRILLLRREHRGLGDTKNAAVEAASGEFVVVLDADDAYLPERLEALGQAASARPDLDIITTDAFLEVDGRVVGRFYDRAAFFSAEDQRRALLERNFIFGAGAAVRRRRLIDVGGFDVTIAFSEDWECWMRLVFSGSKVGLIPEPLYRYRVHEGAASADKLRAYELQVETLEKARAFELTPGESSVLESSIARYSRTAERERARRALLDGAPDARRRWLTIARHRGHGARSRIKAVLVAMAPPVGRLILRHRERRKWRGAAGIEVPRRRDGV